jgi:hypothetical protein
MCIAIEYAKVPSAAAARAGDRSGSRGNKPAAAAAAAVPCTN